MAEENVDQGKRNFIKLMIVLSAGAAAGGTVKTLVSNAITPQVGLKSFPTLEIVDSSGNPLQASKIPVNTPQIYIYYYPLTDDPNFLINLGDSNGNPRTISSVSVKIPASGNTFQSPGGVGPNKSIVSSSAICQHLGCVPPIIRFYPPGNSIPSHPELSNTEGLIHCNCHGSTYDPNVGFSVVTGPTVKPLPNTILNYDSSKDTLSVVSMVGPTIYGKANDLSGGTPFPSGTTTTKATQLQISA